MMRCELRAALGADGPLLSLGWLQDGCGQIDRGLGCFGCVLSAAMPQRQARPLQPEGRASLIHAVPGGTRDGGAPAGEHADDAA